MANHMEMNQGFARLFQLDRALHSASIETQHDALCSFPRFFADSHSSARLLDSGLLKLVDHFRNSDNEMRVATAKVIQECAGSLGRLTQANEATRRLALAWDAFDNGDLLSRALVIRCYLYHDPNHERSVRIYASLAEHLRDNVEVFYRTVESLKSSDEAEMDAAIGACTRFVALSPDLFIPMFADIAVERIGNLDPWALARVKLTGLLRSTWRIPWVCFSVYGFLANAVLETELPPKLYAAMLETMAHLAEHSDPLVNEHTALLHTLVHHSNPGLSEPAKPHYKSFQKMQSIFG